MTRLINRHPLKRRGETSFRHEIREKKLKLTTKIRCVGSLRYTYISSHHRPGRDAFERIMKHSVDEKEPIKLHAKRRLHPDLITYHQINKVDLVLNRSSLKNSNVFVYVFLLVFLRSRSKGFFFGKLPLLEERECKFEDARQYHVIENHVRRLRRKRT